MAATARVTQASRSRAHQDAAPGEHGRDAREEPRVPRPAELGDEGEVEPDPSERAGARDHGERNHQWLGQPILQGEEDVGRRGDQRARDDSGTPTAAEEPVAGDAPAETARGPADLGQGQEPRGVHRLEPEGLGGVEREVGQHRGLGARERQAADEHDQDTGTAEERRDLGKARARGRRHARRPRRRPVRERDGEGGGERGRARHRERPAPSPDRRHRWQAERGDDAAERESRLLDPHRTPRRRGGNHSRMALPVDGFSTLNPKPATRSAASSHPNPHASAARRTIAPVKASPTASVRRTP